MNDDPAPAPQRSKLFDFTFNLGHLFIIISFLFSGSMFYADKESHSAVEEQKIEQLFAANLPTRVQSLETATTDFRAEVTGRLDRNTVVLTQILLNTQRDPKSKP